MGVMSDLEFAIRNVLTHTVTSDYSDRRSVNVQALERLQAEANIYFREPDAPQIEDFKR